MLIEPDSIELVEPQSSYELSSAYAHPRLRLGVIQIDAGSVVCSASVHQELSQLILSESFGGLLSPPKPHFPLHQLISCSTLSIRHSTGTQEAGNVLESSLAASVHGRRCPPTLSPHTDLIFFGLNLPAAVAVDDDNHDDEHGNLRFKE
ncbi:hypothetical protein EVAR_69937_1 [Eumeta japonica]|uniref:Uncharacterized protein n=1 Tax=Eumeta variegata TaxID=151549 RepID=A0A4C2A5P0_EUMVA|nr:hypothetical protein EVAR_69937_1 [Eumeta japonica]